MYRMEQAILYVFNNVEKKIRKTPRPSSWSKLRIKRRKLRK